MPVHLQPTNVLEELDNVRSALILSCPVCAPASLAVQTDSPWFDAFRHGVKTAAFERHICELRQSIEERGIRTGTHVMYTPSPMMCIWTRGQQRRLRRRANGYDAVIVLGCESAEASARDALDGTGCRVLLGMKTTGLTNAIAQVERPLRVTFSEKKVVPASAGHDSVENAS